MSSKFNFSLPQNTSYIFNDQSVVSIISIFKKELYKSLPNLEQALSRDILEGNKKINLFECIKSFYSEEENTNFLPHFSANFIQDGIGTIASIYNGNPIITLKLIILSLRTHNQMYFITKNYSNLTTQIINILKICLQQCNYQTNIVELLNINNSDFFQNQKEFDCLLFIGSKNEYIAMQPHLQIPSIFQDYGSIYVVVDSNISQNSKNILLEMDHFAFENDIEIHYLQIEQENLETLFNKLNFFGSNQNITLFTESTKLAYQFLNSLKCKKIFLNTNPFMHSFLDWKEENFLIQKEIIFPK